jgi:hypothetical protein
MGPSIATLEDDGEARDNTNFKFVRWDVAHSLDIDTTARIRKTKQ